ncbi:MAG: HNH endonuclease [Deltaproteobacteria bacterium]|nr:HNH endonuclease [Deltaproteobacteria bacterium]
MATTDEILLSETDGACAYCGIKDYRVLTTHHIIQETPKDESYDNKIILCHNCHHLYHEGKGPSLEDLKDIKKRLICKILTQQGINALKMAYREDFVSSSPYLVNHLIELHLLQFKEHVMTYVNNVVIEAIYELTEKGKEFAEKWDLK